MGSDRIGSEAQWDRIAAVFVVDRGLLAFTSAAFAEAQRSAGLVQCPACWLFKCWPQARDSNRHFREPPLLGRYSWSRYSWAVTPEAVASGTPPASPIATPDATPDVSLDATPDATTDGAPHISVLQSTPRCR